ncbi:MAG: vWA domain-containing protein [Acidiferrobacter sp.]
MAAHAEPTQGEEGPPLDRLMGFARFLRAQGFRFGLSETLAALEGLVPLVMDRARMRWALRSLLCGQVSDWRRFDVLFDDYWRGHEHFGRSGSGGGGGIPDIDEARSSPNTSASGDRAGAGAGVGAGALAHGGASGAEFTTSTDFRWLTDRRHVEEAGRLAAQMACSLRHLMWRRLRPAKSGRHIHLRRTLRRNLAHGGIPIDRVFRHRRRRLPRLVLVLDVSRSMSLYSHIFLRFAGGILDVFHDAYAFAYHTRLVSITDALRESDSLRLADKLKARGAGWGGGTRIGACLEELLQQRPGRLLHRRTIVIIVSDGLDTGSPEDLERALRRIRGRVRRVVWCNPLLGREGYEPLTRGMRVALPHVDLFAAAHSLESLAALVPRLAAL